MIETSNKCDMCRYLLGEGDTIYCQACFSDLESEINVLKDRVYELEKEITELECERMEDK